VLSLHDARAGLKTS